MGKTITEGHELPVEEANKRRDRRRALEAKLRAKRKGQSSVKNEGWRQREASGKSAKSKWKR